MKPGLFFRIAILYILGFGFLKTGLISQEKEGDQLILSGELLSDERFLLQHDNAWVWNENRLSLGFDKKTKHDSRFYSEIWFRNMGMPKLTSAEGLFNKGFVDPITLEIREAYVQINGFLSPKIDLTIGRQRIAWGTADKLNPTDNLNPLDMEDILDFGRHRSSDAVRIVFYFNSDYSVHGTFIPLFQPANMPVGIFADAFNPSIELPSGLSLQTFSDTLLMPRNSLGKTSTTAFRFKGFIKGVDFSFSYVRGYDGIPFGKANAIVPVDLSGGVDLHTELSFLRTHIIGADIATSIAGFGFWAEGALFLIDKDAIMTTDISALFPMSPVPVIQDSLMLKKSEPWLKFIVGGDYFFADGSYLNMQYIHGFIHERGRERLNDYFFLNYEMKFFNEKLTLAPLSGGFVVVRWNNIKNNHALIYMPRVGYMATPNTELSLTAILFNGKGDNLFAGMNDYDMIKFCLQYSF